MRGYEIWANSCRDRCYCVTMVLLWVSASVTRGFEGLRLFPSPQTPGPRARLQYQQGPKGASH